MKLTLALIVVTALAGQTADSRKPACQKSGGVFNIDPIANVMLVKRDGYVNNINFTKATVFTRLSLSGSAPAPISASDVKVGDLICVSAVQEGETAAAVSVVPRSDLERAQREFLTHWQQDSTFGIIQSFSTDRQSFVVTPSLTWGDGLPVTVALDSNVRYRTFPTTATKLADAAPLRFEDLQIGNSVYVRGKRLPGDPVIQASQVVKGGVRGIVGSIVSTDALQSAVKLRETGSGRQLNVSLPGGDLYRTSESLTNPMRVETELGVKLVRIGMADLQPGDAVLVFGTTSNDSLDVPGLALITKFGSFGVAPNGDSEQVNWFLK